MADHRMRRDSYGKPLPTLVPASEHGLYSSAANTVSRERLHTLLDELMQDVLQRGVNAEVTLRCIVADGTVQEQVYVTVTRRYGGGPGWRKPGEGR